MRRHVVVAIVSLLGACGLSTGCGGGELELVEPRDLPASSGAPSLRKVVDLGNTPIDPRVPLDPSASDGVATIGEALLIEGSGIGRQPTVFVGGVPTEVIGRTGNGGVVVRVPAGAPAGVDDIRVAQEGGLGTTTFPVRRYVLVLEREPGSLETYSIAPGKAAPVSDVGHPISIPGASLLAVGAGGGAAYVVSPGQETAFTIVDLAAKAGPRIATTFSLPISRPVALTAAGAAPALAIVSARQVLLADTKDVLRVSTYDPFSVPSEVMTRPIEHAALSPDGRFLALANRDAVVVYDVSVAVAPSAVARLAAGKGEEAPVRDVAWKSEGETLYVAYGADAASEKTGPRDPRIVPYTLTAAAQGPGLVAGTPIPLPAGSSPEEIELVHSRPLGAGTAIALPPDQPLAYVQAIDEPLVALSAVDLHSAEGLSRAADLLDRSSAGHDAVLKVTAAGNSAPLPGDAVVGGGIAVTPDDSIVLSLGCRRAGASGSLVATLAASLFVVPTDGSAPQPPVPLGTLTPDHLGPPCAVGALAIQP